VAAGAECPRLRHDDVDELDELDDLDEPRARMI